MFFGVQVILNGEQRTLSEGLTIAGLIDHLGLNQRRIAVEVNREIVAREQYPVRALANGDQVEIVHFVGGG
jgi:sulfur carrier protein